MVDHSVLYTHLTFNLRSSCNDQTVDLTKPGLYDHYAMAAPYIQHVMLSRWIRVVYIHVCKYCYK